MDYGGSTNLEVNGDRRIQEDLSYLNGDTVGNATVRIPQPSDGDDEGRAVITGSISSFSVGGQEFFVDNFDFGPSDDPLATVGFDSVTPQQSSYEVGDEFTADGVSMRVDPYFFSDGREYTDGSGYLSGDSDPSFLPGNVNLRVNIGSIPGSGGGEANLVLEMTGDTAEAGGEATIDYILTNRGSAEATGLQGYVYRPSSDWTIEEAGAFTTLGAGETATASVTLAVPTDARGEYTFDGTVESESGSSATASCTVTVEPANETPEAAFSYEPSEPVVGEEVTFDAAAASDPDGTIVQYSWEFDDDSADADGVTTTRTFDSPGDYAVTLTVTDGEGATASVTKTVTVEQTPFGRWKEAHLETATRLDELAVSNFGAAERASAANEAYTTAVDDGRLSRTDATEAVQRLDRGLGITEDVFEYTTDAPELSTNEFDLIGEMARPVLDTTLELAMTAISIGKKLAKGAGLGTKNVLKVAKSKAFDAMTSLLSAAFGNTVDVASEVKTKGDTIVSKLQEGVYETVDQMLEFKEQLLDELVESVSASLQYAMEQSLLFSPVVSEVYPDGTGVSLTDGLAVFYAKLSADPVANAGLDGTMAGASTAASDASASIQSEAEDTQALIADAKEFNEEYSLSTAIYDLFETPDSDDIVQTLVSAVLFLAGGVVDAFSTGGGYGALVKISVTHHLGLWGIQAGDPL